MGDSKASFFAVLISALANVALDILFVAVLSWGVVGAAIATVIAQALMAVFIIIYAPMRHKILRAGIKEYRLHRDIIFEGARLGLPPMIQSCITSAGNLILQGFMNSFGSATVAAITAAYRVDSIILLPVINLGSAISTMTAQSRGAGKPERIRQFFRTGAAMAAGISLILSFTVFFFGGALVSMFGIHETSIAIGGAFFRRLGSFYIFFGIGNSLRGALEGTGDVFFSSVIGILSLGLRVLFSFVLVGIFDNMVIAFAEGFSWIGMVLMYALRMYKKRGEMGFGMPNTQ